jgi:hypothetical protein
VRFVRHIEDADSNLVDVLYYCCELCYVTEPTNDVRGLPGGWWPCLDAALTCSESCRTCGEALGQISSRIQ